MSDYYRAIPMQGAARPANARQIAGGWCWFDRAEKITRGAGRKLVGIDDLPNDLVDQITAPRKTIAGLSFDVPRLMGILNVTPDSFSDGGDFASPDAALARALDMQRQGADMIDVGGESTRPGADLVQVDVEISRTAPVIAAIRKSADIAISIDTRKAKVAMVAKADLINDVSALTYDPALADLTAKTNSPICLMHAQGDPKTMQDAPIYDDVLLDVYDFLAERVKLAVRIGIPRERIIIDPGIGFGKTQQHNLNLLRDISLFHTLGCAILLGASRKKFIADISGAKSAKSRVFGSVSITLAAITQGIQMHRVHDIEATKQAIALQMAIWGKT